MFVPCGRAIDSILPRVQRHGKTIIVTSANFTTSDIHGDFKSADSRGNPNNLLKLESPELAKVFREEFAIMSRKKKTIRSSQSATERVQIYMC